MNLTEVLPSRRRIETYLQYRTMIITISYIKYGTTISSIYGGIEEPCWGRALNKNPLQLEQLYLKGDFRIV